MNRRLKYTAGKSDSGEETIREFKEDNVKWRRSELGKKRGRNEEREREREREGVRERGRQKERKRERGSERHGRQR